MILHLRQRHRRLFSVLGVLLPAAFIAGIAARRPVPSMGLLPDGLASTAVQFPFREWRRVDLFSKAPVQVSCVREESGRGRLALEFAAGQDFVKPDLIVYWLDGRTAVADTLPEDARLLGAFTPGVPLPLPEDAVKSQGVLVLYSLADGEIVDVSKPFSALDPSSTAAGAGASTWPTPRQPPDLEGGDALLRILAEGQLGPSRQVRSLPAPEE